MSFLDQQYTTRRAHLINAYPSKGTIKESGLMYDSTKVTVMVVKSNPGGSKGFTTLELKWGSSDNYNKIKHLNFLELGPVAVDLQVEEVVLGSGENERREMLIYDMLLIDRTVKSSPLKAANA
jgi:hypothetical protein